MTREQTIQKIVDYFVEQGQDRGYVEDAFLEPTPLYGSLVLLEALGLVKYDDDPPAP